MKAKDCSRASMLVNAIERVREVATQAEGYENGLGILFGQFCFGEPLKGSPVVYLDRETTIMVAQAVHDIAERELKRLGVDLD